MLCLNIKEKRALLLPFLLLFFPLRTLLPRPSPTLPPRSRSGAARGADDGHVQLQGAVACVALQSQLGCTFRAGIPESRAGVPDAWRAAGEGGRFGMRGEGQGPVRCCPRPRGGRPHVQHRVQGGRRRGGLPGFHPGSVHRHSVVRIEAGIGK